MNNTPTPRTDDGGRYCSHQRRERWIKQPNNTMNTPTTRTDERKASFALDTIRQLEAELAAVTEQLKAAQDGWHDEITKGLTELRRAESIYTKAQERAERAEEQRGRLAEALKQIQGVGLVAVDAFDELDRIDEIVDEALQSLNQNITITDRDEASQTTK